MGYVERIAENPQWKIDMSFVGEALFQTEGENLPRIKQIIETYSGKLQENRDMRKTAYLAMVRNLRDFPNPDYMRWHIAQIPKEKDKYILSSMLDEIKDWPYLPPETDISPILDCVKSDKWLIYQGAIKALGICNMEIAREAVRPFLRLEPIRKNEPVYMYLCETLARIGTPEDVPLLRAISLRSTNRNIKHGLMYTISEIELRFQNNILPF